MTRSIIGAAVAAATAGWQQIRTVVEQQGYNSCLMLTSPNTDGLPEIRPLCTL